MRHLKKHHGLNMRYQEELDEILTNEKNEAIGVKTKNGEEIKCEFVGLTAGVSPNIAFVKESGISCQRGILINRFFETSAKDIYAIGDCAEFSNPLPGRRPLEQVWYTGKIMGEQLAQTLTGNKTSYNPGYWFNSAKFMDVEYQTYGTVLKELLEGQEEFIYQHHKEEILLHFVFEKESRKFIGVNNFGARMRHPVFNSWLLKEASIEEVLTDLKTANFDPEFYSKYENEVVAQFNQQFGTSITVNKVKWWQQLTKA